MTLYKYVVILPCSWSWYLTNKFDLQNKQILPEEITAYPKDPYHSPQEAAGCLHKMLVKYPSIDGEMTKAKNPSE